MYACLHHHAKEAELRHAQRQIKLNSQLDIGFEVIWIELECAHVRIQMSDWDLQFLRTGDLRPDLALYFIWRGVLRDLRPDVALLAAIGRGNVDGEPVQGTLAGFIASEVELLRAKTVVLCHHDDWMPPLTHAIDVDPIRHELKQRTPAARLVEMGYLEGRRIFDDASS